MRILVLSERYPPHITGGYEVACASIANGLRGRGHEVTILTSDFGQSGDWVDEPGVRRDLHYQQNARSSWQLARWETADQRTLRAILSGWKPDVVYAWSLFHLFPSLHRVLGEADVPVFLNIQDLWLPRHLEAADRLRQLWARPASSLPKRVAKSLLRSAVRWRNPTWLRPVTAEDLAHYHIVFCSRFRMAEHEQRGLPSRSRRLVYNGIEADRFPTAPAHTPGEPLRVLFAGRLVHEKGVHTAVEAVVELARRGGPPAALTVAGPPSYPLEYSQRLREMVAKAGLDDRVQFLGMVPQGALRELYGRHHVLVFPSVGNEGFPMTILEAMASGLPVVGTTTGGSGEILRDGETGLAYPAGDAAALADRLARLAVDSTLCRGLAQSGRRCVREWFSLEKVVAETEGLLQEVGRGRARLPSGATVRTP